MILIEFDIELEDLVAFSTDHSENSSTYKKSFLLSWIILPVMMVGAASYFFLQNGGYSPLALILIGVLWAVFYPVRMRRYLRRTTEAMLSEPSYRKAFGHYEVTLDEEGIVSKSPDGEAAYKWDAVDRLSLTDTHLHIFFTGAKGFPISRSQVSGEVISRTMQFVEQRSELSD